jgi:hypothetical protein
VKAIGGLEPISRAFGYDRGTPIDRYYLDRFLDEHNGDIRGRVTIPGISQIEDGEAASGWYWSLSAVAARRLPR